MNRTAISHIFSGNVSSDILESSLSQLQQQGVAEKQVIQTEGRPAEVWVAKSP
jgi:DNA-binding HxlR family transcriptional regulator